MTQHESPFERKYPGGPYRQSDIPAISKAPEQPREGESELDFQLRKNALSRSMTDGDFKAMFAGKDITTARQAAEFWANFRDGAPSLTSGFANLARERGEVDDEWLKTVVGGAFEKKANDYERLLREAALRQDRNGVEFWEDVARKSHKIAQRIQNGESAQAPTR